MAIQITSDTVVKILVRRGTDSERKQTVLTEGELGYTIDSQRVFVGDGITPGGNSVGIKYLGDATLIDTFNTLAHKGDFAYQTDGLGNETSQVLYAYTGDTTKPWYDVHPKTYTSLENGIVNLQKAPDGKWRVASNFFSANAISKPVSTPPSGLTVVYEDEVAETLFSLPNIKNRIDFDSRYLSLCAFPITQPASWHFGDIRNKTVDNSLAATVNILNSLFVNGRFNPYQIQIYANKPGNSGSSLIEAISGDFEVRSHDRLRLFAGDKEAIRIVNNGDSITTTFSAVSAGSYGYPDFDFKGASVFRNDVFFDANSDVTMYGNLSVFGDVTYLDTYVTTTSSLSVVMNNTQDPAFVVQQLYSGAASNQTLIRAIEGGTYTNFPILQVKERQYVAINRPYNATLSDGYNVDISGDLRLTKHPLIGNGRLLVDYSDSASGIISLNARRIQLTTYNTAGSTPGPDDFTLDSGGTTRNVTVSGGLQVTQDITAFYSSDINLKDNIKPINNALDKLIKISGVTFDWNEKSGKSGKDYGVIAQEIENILPEIVTTRKETGYKAVNYDKIIPLIIEAIKELANKNN